MSLRSRILTAAAASATAITVLTAAGGPAAAADAARPAPSAAASWVAQSIKDQLARKPGGVVTNGDTVSYAAEGVKITYRPHTAGGSGAASPATPSYGCPSGNICLFSDDYNGNRVLQTTSLWCGSNHLLWLSNYGIWGNVRSATGNNSFWSRMLFDNGWWSGTQWTLQPYGFIQAQSAANVNAFTVCVNYGDLVSNDYS